MWSQTIIWYIQPIHVAIIFFFLLFFIILVPLLTYLLTKEQLTPEEVNGLAIDVIAGGVDNVSREFLP